MKLRERDYEFLLRLSRIHQRGTEISDSMLLPACRPVALCHVAF